MHICVGTRDFFAVFDFFGASLRGVFVVIFPIYALFTSACMINQMNPIWASGVPQGSILDLFCFTVIEGKAYVENS